MDLTVTHRSQGSEAYLLLQDKTVLLYDRYAKTVNEVKVPALFAGRSSWLKFDGDPEPIIGEVRDLLDQQSDAG